MFDYLRLTREPGHRTALPPTTASTGRDRQLVAQRITKQTRPKYPNICPKWTDRRPCERATPEPSKTPTLGQWFCAELDARQSLLLTIWLRRIHRPSTHIAAASLVF